MDVKLWMVSINYSNEVRHTRGSSRLSLVACSRHTSKWSRNLIHRFTDNKKLTITVQLQDLIQRVKLKLQIFRIGVKFHILPSNFCVHYTARKYTRTCIFMRVLDYSQTVIIKYFRKLWIMCCVPFQFNRIFRN